MTILTRHWKVAILWALSLIVVSVISSSAQDPRIRRGATIPTQAPTVISGNDVGFRIERTEDGIPVGRVVVRVNGSWVDTAPAR